MERVVCNRAFTLSKTFYSDGVAATVTGTPTIALTRSDGTTVTTSAVAGSGVGPFTTTVTAANNTLLDTLTATWVATISAQSSTYIDTVEVAGDTLFTVADARTIKPLDSTSTYPTATVTDMRTLVEQAFERPCGVAFVPRYTQETLSGNGSCHLPVKWPKIRSIRSVTIKGVALTGPQLATVVAMPHGALYYPTGWTWGIGNIVVGYEHGHDTPPARVASAAMFEARYRLVMKNSPTDDRATTMTTDQGVFSLVVPGRGGATLYLPESNAVVGDYSLSVGIA